jgi:enamine deaminase RidA (YjgF/YER057c/UK114 family)
MTHQPLNRAAVAQRIGKYSDGMLVQPDLRWVFTSGTPGLMPDGTCPEGITAQAEWAWRNVLAILEEGGMGVQDLVKVTHYLTRAQDIPAYVAVRARFLGEVRPASMLLVVPALVRPEFVVEVEACAARAH